MARRDEVKTAAQLLTLPDDGWRYELVAGELRRMSPAGYRHGCVAMRIGALLAAHVRDRRLGVVCAAGTGFLLAERPDTVRAPDVAFVARERAEPQNPSAGFFRGAPDLAVEVLSPSDTYSEVEAKALDWLRAGTRIVLVADPERRTVTAYRAPTDAHVFDGDATVDCGDVVPGFALRLPDAFSTET